MRFRANYLHIDSHGLIGYHRYTEGITVDDVLTLTPYIYLDFMARD